MLELGVASVSKDLINPGTDYEYKILPKWGGLSLTASPGKESVLTFNYPRTGPLAHMLIPGARIKVLFPFYNKDVGQIRVEPPDMVFTLDGEGHNEETANDQTMVISGKSTQSNFSNLLLAPAVGSTHVDEDIFKYSNLSIGQLAKASLSTALSRSPDSTVALSFSDSHDSIGVPWGNPIDAKFTPGQPFSEVLDWLSSLGFAYSTFGKNKIWIPGQGGETYTSDLLTDSSSTEYKLNLYANPIDGFGYSTYYLDERYEVTVKKQTEFTNIVNQVFVTGAEGICTWVKREDSIQSYGVREGAWNVSNASLHSTLLAAGEKYLDVYAYPRVSQTIDINFPPDGAILFWFPKFMFGKSVNVDRTHRIEMLSFRSDSAIDPGTLTITMDNFFDGRREILDQRLARLGISR